MRSRVLLLAVVFLVAWPGPLVADDEPDALARVRTLGDVIARDDATWDEKWRAYRNAKEAIADARGEEKVAAEAAYSAIQGAVAEAIRRENLPVSGWLMGLFGAGLLWGGFAFCIGVARKKGASGGKGAG